MFRWRMTRSFHVSPQHVPPCSSIGAPDSAVAAVAVVSLGAPPLVQQTAAVVVVQDCEGDAAEAESARECHVPCVLHGLLRVGDDGIGVWNAGVRGRNGRVGVKMAMPCDDIITQELYRGMRSSLSMGSKFFRACGFMGAENVQPQYLLAWLYPGQPRSVDQWQRCAQEHDNDVDFTFLQRHHDLRHKGNSLPL